MEMVEFVPEPNCGRGTIGILWSCFSTLFLVIWVACHPRSLEPDSKGSWLSTEKITDCLFYFLMPEAGAAGGHCRFAYCPKASKRCAEITRMGAVQPQTVIFARGD
ncbi:hypothetical protein QBC37DRAFT_12158 [Rhypophila decipiens]|uniref:Uncharacterized protein n=1 Tax=Rhypophila decipiens TaxID=261697 RepID=A0AAN6Y3I0_9PEZI|nr:hypothetical protein QBC37DRAFT_12158 [Rhypophila decipiens]